MRVLLFLERLFSIASMEYSKQLIGIVSEDEMFMEIQLLKYKPAIKFSATARIKIHLYRTNPTSKDAKIFTECS